VAIALQNGGSSDEDGDEVYRPMAEINVTPMVDVMLVLLIIFMVTAPLIQQGVKVNLPETKAAPVEANEKKIVISIDVNKHAFIGETEVKLDEIEEKLKTNAKAQADKEVYLHADTDLPYGIVVNVMAAAQRAGITNVGMITDPVGAGRASRDKDSKEKHR
jgi:biopolymer transport protein TolR